MKPCGDLSLTVGTENHLIPLSNYGVKSMSMGYLVRQDSPVAWRGMMVVKALQQLLHEVDWGGLDMLVLDLPPGTGDTQLTIAQQVELDGTCDGYDIRIDRAYTHKTYPTLQVSLSSLPPRTLLSRIPSRVFPCSKR